MPGLSRQSYGIQIWNAGLQQLEAATIGLVASQTSKQLQGQASIGLSQTDVVKELQRSMPVMQTSCS